MLPIESSMEELLASEASELRGLHFEGPPPLRWVEVVVAERWNEVLRFWVEGEAVAVAEQLDGLRGRRREGGGGARS